MNTICAISTSQGGAIGIIRVSGDEAITITDTIFKPASGKPLALSRPNTVHYGKIIDTETSEDIDDVLINIYKAPHSYTGEDSTEIMCHNSSYITQQIIRLLCQNGCTLARPGEYTQRAFLNGKMDLSQAEAVADLISSSNKAMHTLAIKQMRGGFSTQLRALKDQLLEMTTLLELEIDFSEEDVEFADREKLHTLATSIRAVITHLIDSFRAGNAIKNGIPVAIVGETNVGKSTLLNRLLNEDRALVSDIRGTTRDSIEECMTIEGTLYRFIDTAGIRKTDDIVENMGIERTIRKISEAEIIILLTEPGVPYPSITINPEQTTIHVVNKSDTIDAPSSTSTETIYISAKHNQGIDNLLKALTTAAARYQVADSDIIVTNLRHVEALRHALVSLDKVIAALTNTPDEATFCDLNTPDIIALDLHSVIDSLAEITGDITSDDTLHNIFSHFCIGK